MIWSKAFRKACGTECREVSRKPSRQPSHAVLASLSTLLLLLSSWPGAAIADDSMSLYRSGMAAEAAGDWAGAAELYRQAGEGFVGSDAVNAALMFGNAGRSYAQLQNYDAADAAWTREARFWDAAGYLQSRIAAERKAEWVRSDVRLFVSTPAQAVGNRFYTGGKYEPVTGAYLGVYGERDPGVHDPGDGEPFYTEGVAAVTGRQHPLFLLYANWSSRDVIPAGHAAKIKAAGGALQWALQPDQGLAAVTDGPYLRQAARAARDAGIPILLRFGGEMNGNWIPWGGDPALYREKFRLVARVFHEEAPNVAMLWAPAYFPLYTMNDYYPGDDVVDWVGISAYGVYDDSLDPVAPLGQRKDSRSLSDTFAEVYRLYSGRKPIMLAEGAIGYFDYQAYQDRTPWALANIRRFYAALPRVYPRVKAVTWFDVDLGSAGSNDQGPMVQNYRLTDPDARSVLHAYQQAIADPYYLSAIPDAADQVYLDGSEFGVSPRPVELSSYVKAYNPYITRVEYWIGGQLVGQSSSLDPWAVTVDFSPYVNQWVTLTVRAYGSDGRRATERSIPVRVGAIRVTLNGAPVAFDYQPRMEGYSTLVPIRQLATLTGSSIESAGGVVTMVKGDRRIELRCGSTSALVNGQPITLLVAPVEESGRTLVPLRVAEQLGLRVDWDEETRTAQMWQQ